MINDKEESEKIIQSLESGKQQLSERVAELNNQLLILKTAAQNLDSQHADKEQQLKSL